MEIGEANDGLVNLEVAGALAAMESEDTWSGPVTKAARKAEKKAEQDLWQALESLDLKNAREAAKEVTKKEFFKRRGGGKLQINWETQNLPPPNTSLDIMALANRKRAKSRSQALTHRWEKYYPIQSVEERRQQQEQEARTEVDQRVWSLSFH